MWMITTNDNIDGLRFYQRRGYVMCAVHINAIDQSRKIADNSACRQLRN